MGKGRRRIKVAGSVREEMQVSLVLRCGADAQHLHDGIYTKRQLVYLILRVNNSLIKINLRFSFISMNKRGREVRANKTDSNKKEKDHIFC